MSAFVKREKVLSARETASEAGTSAALVVERIDGVSLAEFDEITVYLDVAALVGGTQATGTLTLTGNAEDTEVVVLGDETYTFVTALSTDPAVPFEVLQGANASDSLDNLIAAINGAAGEGTLYGTGTTANALATAAAGDGDTMVATAIVGGTAGNSIDSTTDIADGSWGASTLGSGADDATLDLYLQRALTDTPEIDTDADWEDLYAFPQLTTALFERVIDLPLPQPADVDGSLGSAGRARTGAALTPGLIRSGHWGDRIRVVEKVGGNAASPGTYDLTLIGRRRG